MSNLYVPIEPTNMRRDFGSLEVTGDVYLICDRIAELSRRLIVREWPTGSAARWRYVISEACEDGVERFVMGANQLDGRIIEHLQHMLHVPFEKRLAEAEALVDKLDAEAHEAELDELYERIGAPMLPLLERTGFSNRPRSYPKSGHTGGRGSLRRQNRPIAEPPRLVLP